MFISCTCLAVLSAIVIVMWPDRAGSFRRTLEMMLGIAGFRWHNPLRADKLKDLRGREKGYAQAPSLFIKKREPALFLPFPEPC
ncbi:hypothetical protein F5882DRAFT_395662 [Hyaloscypha sp. PMI_1271]|nr:hypothetical protein F5882DRAFT_395662 [Hyaloscypha sp. PMI_1271]